MSPRSKQWHMRAFYVNFTRFGTYFAINCNIFGIKDRNIDENLEILKKFQFFQFLLNKKLSGNSKFCIEKK